MISLNFSLLSKGVRVVTMILYSLGLKFSAFSMKIQTGSVYFNMCIKKRKKFLSGCWKAYPVVKGSWKAGFCGRIHRMTPKSLFIKNQDSEYSISVSDNISISDSVSKRDKNEHPHLGPSIPHDCLVSGDIVYYCFQRKALFLLSPCKRVNERLFDSRPEEWSGFLSQVESFFTHNHFLHLRTPFLLPSPGVDHHIDFMTAKATGTGRQWCLPTSPEIHLKKYLCRGYDRIFEIKNCFRDDLPGPHHLPEFTMLEWYQSFEDLSKAVKDVSELLEHLLGKPMTVDRVRLSQCFKEQTAFILKAETSQKELLDWACQLNIKTHPRDQWNDIFFRIFMEKVEPHLGKENPVVVFDWPHQQASLARIKGGWSQRFELYWKGVELANAYQEVNDPSENVRRFEREQELRRKEGRFLCDFDENFFREMESAMPPAVGVALGLNRLFMLCRSRESLYTDPV